MSSERSAHLPDYAAADFKAALLAAGACGTIYSLVMPESEAALEQVVDGADRRSLIEEHGLLAALDLLDERRLESWLGRYHEPWTQKQDSMHEEYFEHWLRWSAPVVSLRPEDFPFRYPTAGASEGIFKIMAEYAASCAGGGTIHILEGEYEGFPAYAEALKLPAIRHDRSRWRDIPAGLGGGGQFWISQPSAIDGGVWEDFGDFIRMMAGLRPDVQIIPDLTYVGSVARPFAVDLNSANIPAFVISHSKPFGGYYHRVGGVFARRDFPSLFGNKWFKNLQSLAWATEMMRSHGVFDLPRRYRPVQEQAAELVGTALGLSDLGPADVLLLGVAGAGSASSPLLRSVLRGSDSEKIIRLCLTPAMTCLIDPAMAPRTAPAMKAAWGAGG